MDKTLKAICSLLKDDDAEVRRAAALVIAGIAPKEAPVTKAVGEALVAATDESVADALLQALQQNPHEQSVRYLLEVIDREVVQSEYVLDAIASIGTRAVPELRQHFSKVDPAVQAQIARVLPQIRSDAAFGLMLEVWQSDNLEAVRAGVHALREEVELLNKKERSKLFQKLKGALTDAKYCQNHNALLAVIISLGIVADGRAKRLLIPYTQPEHDEQTRRYALLSLARIEYSGEGHGDLIKALLPILKEENENLVRHAVEVLQRVKPRKSDTEQLLELLETSPHSAVQAYAIQALGRLGTITNARRIVAFLEHKDHNLRHAAHTALNEMSDATQVLLEELDKAVDQEYADEIVAILQHHHTRVNKEKARDLVQQLFDYLEANDKRHQTFRKALLAVSPETLRNSVMSRVAAARKKKDYTRVRDCLGLLEGTEFMTPEVRHQLMVAKLKTSRKDMSRAFRLNDYALELVGEMLHEEGKPFQRKLLKSSELDLEDLYYVGFHFCERLNEERRFGADVLEHVAKKGKRTKYAKLAREKLRAEGH